MAIPTPAQIDDAVPSRGTPNRAKTNEVLKGLATAANLSQRATVEYARFEDIPTNLPSGQVVESAYDETLYTVGSDGQPGGERSVYQTNDYAKIRAYTGRGARLRVVDSTGAHWWVRRGAAADNGGTILTDASGRSWEREYGGSVNAGWFGAAGDGVTSDSQSLQTWLSYISSGGKDGYVPEGSYKMDSGISSQLTESFSVSCAADAEFIASEEFPGGNNKIIHITTGSNASRTFKWVGGRFNAYNQPNSLPGEANDIFSVNAENCSLCVVHLDRTYSGEHWLDAGSDSHLMIAGPSNIDAYIHEAVGAVDCVMYISRDGAGLKGQSLRAKANVYKSAMGISVKRRFETVDVDVTAIDCGGGAATDGANINGYPVADGGHGHVFRVNAKRTAVPLYLKGARNVQGFVNADMLGVKIPGFTSDAANAVNIFGSSGCQLFINAHGVHPEITRSAQFRVALVREHQTDTLGLMPSEKNEVFFNCSGIGTVFEEGIGCDNNTLRGKSSDLLSYVPAVNGTNTTYEFQQANVRKFSNDLRGVKNDGISFFNVSRDNGQVSVGKQGGGAATATHLDFFSSGTVTNDAMVDVSGGNGAAYSGTMRFRANILSLEPLGAVDVTGTFRPKVDDSAQLGQADRRFSNIYLANNPIVTSDEREKMGWRGIRDAERSAALEIKKSIRSFKFTNGVRTHFGVGAQTVGDILTNHGLDPSEYAFWCYDEWDEEAEELREDGTPSRPYRPAGGRHGIRYEELLAFILAAL